MVVVWKEIDTIADSKGTGGHFVVGAIEFFAQKLVRDVRSVGPPQHNRCLCQVIVNETIVEEI